MSQWPHGDSNHARVYRRLKAALIDYRFRPGEQLLIAELADHLHVSSTPVRESLISLQAQALLDAVPRRGFFAKVLNFEEMSGLTQFRFSLLRSCLEPLRASPHLEREGSPGSQRRDNRRATIATADAEATNPVGEHARRIERELESLAALSGNRVICGALRNANNRTHYVRMIDLEMAGRASQLEAELSDLSRAFRRGDSKTALRILRRSMEDEMSRMPTLIKEGLSRAYVAPTWTAIPIGVRGAQPAQHIGR